MAKKRERLTVIFDVLQSISKNSNSIRLTKLLRRSNLSSQSFIDYYSKLNDLGFINEENNDGKRYAKLTEKGFRYLERYQIIAGFMEEFQI